MASRGIRIEYAGAFYHVMARGNRRERIFIDDDDRRYFLEAVSEACGMTGWRVHAWVLMTNHYHFFIETPEANLVTGMMWLQNTYTRRFNIRHRLWGRLFGDRYKSIVVEGDEPWYYMTLLNYIHLNPIRAGIVKSSEGQSVRDYPWSSIASGYALPPRARAPWLAVADGLASFGYQDTAADRRSFVEGLDRTAREERRKDCGVANGPEDRRMSNLRHGWYWGTQAFSETLLAMADGAIRAKKSRVYQSSPIKRMHDEKEAERIVLEGLLHCGLEEAQLSGLPGSDRLKLEIAKQVRANTAVPLKWIANRLKMRSAANVSQQLRRFRS
jgi:REP element-mobilizing transposase RayT